MWEEAIETLYKETTDYIRQVHLSTCPKCEIQESVLVNGQSPLRHLEVERNNAGEELHRIAEVTVYAGCRYCYHSLTKTFRKDLLDNG